MSDELLELALRCEAATGIEIGAVNTSVLRALGWGFKNTQPVNPAGEIVSQIPFPLLSVDDAMAVVPEGWRIWTADFSIEGRFVWMLSGPKQTWVEHDDGSREGGDDWYQSGVAASAALALTAASLRARASHLRMEVE